MWLEGNHHKNTFTIMTVVGGQLEVPFKRIEILLYRLSNFKVPIKSKHPS